ncbi:MAG: hypothetical protein SGPRY_003438, partial [Prymnesium sp.]
IWAGEALRATGERQLLFLYLANDIMQTSRRKLLESEEKWGGRECGGGRGGELDWGRREKDEVRGEGGLFRRRLADAGLVERGGDESRRRDFVGGGGSERVRGELVCCEACRKTLDFVEEYGDQLVNVLPAAYTGGSERVRGKLLRLLAIWEERKVLPPERVAALRATLGLDQIGGALPAYLDRLGESCLEGLKQERDASLPKLADEPHKASSLLTSHISQVSRSPPFP